MPRVTPVFETDFGFEPSMNNTIQFAIQPASKPVIENTLKRKANDEDKTKAKRAKLTPGDSSWSPAGAATRLKRHLDNDETDPIPAKRTKTNPFDEESIVEGDTAIGEGSAQLSEASANVQSAVPANSALVSVDVAAVLEPDPFPFFALPAEIRLEIYSYLFDNRSPIRLPYRSSTDVALNNSNRLIQNPNPRWGFRRGLIHGACLTNKRLAGEILHYLYSTHTFILNIPYNRDWVTRIGRLNASDLRSVVLSLRSRYHTASDNLLSALSTLRKRGFASLRHLSLEDSGLCANSDFLVRKLLTFGGVPKNSWRVFKELRDITITVAHNGPPRADRPLYEELCLKSGVRVRGLFIRPPMTGQPRRTTVNGGDVKEEWVVVEVEDMKKREEERKRREEERKKIVREAWRKKREEMRMECNLAEAKRVGQRPKRRFNWREQVVVVGEVDEEGGDVEMGKEEN